METKCSRRVRSTTSPIPRPKRRWKKGSQRKSEDGRAKLPGTRWKRGSIKSPRSRGGNWLTAENVEIGDEIEIKGKGRWHDQFGEGEDGKDLVLPVKANGQEFEWRLNKTQMRKMADAFGNKTGDWVGESAIIEKIVKYESLGKKGFKITAEK
ncbi:hypothetical protein AKJ64_03805 [candidate division MSBL1 archaeon SCGC-AAA259E17]|uniref:Uncharacterized protein n=1 Tax=candidate division MSBL1 archaeon SCGC-AAA259E17 TaxID=1698263 RepID=A0A133UDI5_9EURY|nr:hypothetical protein AKJ64_03805 [candidate division MSBL1 archaeon SCGC-AAA259E17]